MSPGSWWIAFSSADRAGHPELWIRELKLRISPSRPKIGPVHLMGIFQPTLIRCISKEPELPVDSMSTPVAVLAIRTALSTTRMSTFDQAVGPGSIADQKALALYAWNALVSAAFFAPLHICEIVVRNAVSDALEITYGPQWPWSGGFEQSLPSPTHGYNPRSELKKSRRNQTSTGKVIAELSFVFWQKMFTARHDSRLWDKHLMTFFPQLDPAIGVQTHRASIHNDLESLRGLRNRIAHHEPIFTRTLTDDLNRIRSLIFNRCGHTSEWMQSGQIAAMIIGLRQP